MGLALGSGIYETKAAAKAAQTRFTHGWYYTIERGIKYQVNDDCSISEIPGWVNVLQKRG